MRLILIRHGEMALNANPVNIGGRSPHYELNENGVEQATKLGEFLKTELDGKNTAWYVSPIIRCQQTFEHITKNFEKEPEKNLKDELMELSQGEWEGKNREETYTLDVQNTINQKQPWFAAPGGESPVDIYLRIGNFLQEMTKTHEKENKTVILVSHGYTTRAAIAFLLNISPKSILNMEISNCGVTEFHYTARGWMMKYCNRVVK